MRPYRYYIAITSQFYFCGIPFRLDTVPKCPLNCSYCFAMSRGGRRTSTGLLADPDQLLSKLDKLRRFGSQDSDVVGELLARRAPVHFGGMSDPFASHLVAATSLRLLTILAEFDYPTVISTKNTNELLKEEVLDVLKKFKHLVIQVSVSTYDSEFARIIEPNVPSPVMRLNALHRLAQEGLYTIVRLQPLYPEQVNEVAKELIPRIGQANVRHVVVEFLKLPVEHESGKTEYLSSKLHWGRENVYQSEHALRTGREWVLDPQYKWGLLQPVIDSIHTSKMTFGAGDYGLNHLSDTDCCCGIDVVEGFNEWFKPNFSNLIRHSKSPILDVGLLEEFPYPEKSIRMYMNSHCRGTDVNTLYDFLKLKWNRPGTENAPDSFLGVSFHGDYDDHGNCLYVKEPF